MRLVVNTIEIRFCLVSFQLIGSDKHTAFLARLTVFSVHAVNVFSNNTNKK